MKTEFLVLASALFLTGCAEVSPILKANESKSVFEGSFYGGETKIRGTDTTGAVKYRLYQQGATGFVPRDLIKEECEQRASEFCHDQEKDMKVLEETVSHHAMRGPGNFPRVELVFVCINKKTDDKAFEDQTYVRLTNLRKLLDAGTITKEEFDREKAKILK